MGEIREEVSKLPIAEDFHSLQGEGVWIGTPMHFIRLAGCCVGKPVLPAKFEYLQGPVSGELEQKSALVQVAPVLKTDEPAWLCHTYDGRPFWCDTDFQRREWATITALLDSTWEKRICLTGGEPLMHGEGVRALVEHADLRGIQVHLETSGTIDIPEDLLELVWISVSPKLGATERMLTWADEIKLLVDEDFDLAKVPDAVCDSYNVFVQPVNAELEVDKANFQRCMDILRARPQWRLSIQQHKLLGLR